MKAWLIGLLLTGILFAGFIALAPSELQYQETYYGKLKAACADTPSSTCCIESVIRMEAKGYRLAEGKQCPASFTTSTLKCPSSYTWCEAAVQKNESAFFQGKVDNGQDMALPDGKLLRFMIGSRCGRGGDGNGGCTFGGYSMTAFLRDRQGNAVDSASSLTEEGDSLLDYLKYGIRIRLDSFEAHDDVTANITIWYAPTTSNAQSIDTAPTSEIADAPTAATMIKGSRIEACGYQIELVELARSPGTRSDWMHQFEIQRTNGEVIDTLTSWGNQEHELQSEKAKNVRIFVKSIEETPTLRANVVFDCNR